MFEQAIVLRHTNPKNDIDDDAAESRTQRQHQINQAQDGYIPTEVVGDTTAHSC